MSQFAPLSLSVKSTLAASTVPAMVYLGYIMKSKYDQSYNNNSNDYGPSNNNYKEDVSLLLKIRINVSIFRIRCLDKMNIDLTQRFATRRQHLE